MVTDEDDQALIISFLAAHGNDSVYMNTLSMMLTKEKMFEKMVLQFLQDIHTSKNDPKFVNILGQVWESYIKGDPNQTIDPVLHVNVQDYTESNVAIVNLQQALIRIPPSQRAIVVSRLITLAKTIAGPQSALATYTSQALAWTERAGTLAPLAIAAVLLSWEALKSISAWWKGEISGARCVANVINAGATIGGGFGGGALGTFLGTMVCPGVGTVIGGVAAGVLGSTAAAALSRWLTEYFFDLPPTVALEKAYEFLGLKASSTNAEINTQFKKLALIYHPDKGGSAQDFHKLQVSVAIIKESRGQGAG